MKGPVQAGLRARPGSVVSRNRFSDQEFDESQRPPNAVNGDYQRIKAVPPIHELLRSLDSASGLVEYLLTHPHEGAVGVPEGEDHARVLARDLNIAMTRERKSGRSSYVG